MKKLIFIGLLFIYFLIVSCDFQSAPNEKKIDNVLPEMTNYIQISNNIGIYEKVYSGYNDVHSNHEKVVYSRIVKMKKEYKTTIGARDTTGISINISDYLSDWKIDRTLGKKEVYFKKNYQYKNFNDNLDKYLIIVIGENHSSTSPSAYFIPNDLPVRRIDIRKDINDIQELSEDYFVVDIGYFFDGSLFCVLDKYDSLYRVNIKSSDSYIVRGWLDSFNVIERVNENSFIARVLNRNGWFLLDHQFRCIAWSENKF